VQWARLLGIFCEMVR